MAFDGGFYDTLAPNTFDDYNVTTSFYDLEDSPSRAQQSTRDKSDKSVDEYEMNEPQDANHAAKMGQRWSNDTPWAANWSFPPYNPQSTRSLRAIALITPDLSSRSTSRRSSLHPPFTPISAGRTLSPTEMKRMSSQYAVHAGRESVTSDVQYRQQPLSIPELVTEQALVGLDFWPDAYSYDTFESSAMGGFHPSAIQELDREEHNYQVTQTMSHRPAPSSFRRSSLSENRTGVWEMNDDRSWCQQKKTLTSDAESVTRAIYTGLCQDSTQRTRDANEEVDPDPVNLYPPVYCDNCGVEFTGKYRASNLGRHRRSKHAEEGPKRHACRFCGKAFKRSDARLGHERKKHALLLQSCPSFVQGA